jgi:hypothetical protein
MRFVTAISRRGGFGSWTLQLLWGFPNEPQREGRGDPTLSLPSTKHVTGSWCAIALRIPGRLEPGYPPPRQQPESGHLPFAKVRPRHLRHLSRFRDKWKNSFGNAKRNELFPPALWNDQPLSQPHSPSRSPSFLVLCRHNSIVV